jgi:NADH-quinone oxidoreductase subunit H
LIFKFFIFPGFLFSVLVGGLAAWADRKVSARLQWRKGPPWHHPLAEMVKLFGKETLIPEGANRTIFFGAPLIGLAAAVLCAVLLWQVNLAPQKGFIGDLIVALYLLTIPPVAVIVGGSASRNPLAALGSSREMKLMLAYELPFILAIFGVVAKTGSLLFGNILAYQAEHGALLFSFSGAIFFLTALLAVQAKLGVPPFDVAEAEQELAGGALIEYSGPPLGMFKLTRMLLLAALPLFLITLFLGGANLSTLKGILWFALKYVFILTLIVLIKNTNPRLRTDQALRFFWGPIAILAAAGFILALVGL